MTKKREKNLFRSVFLITFLIVLFISTFLFGTLASISLVQASDVDSFSQDIDEKAKDIEGKVSEGEEKVENISEGNYGKWNYLGKEWKKIFLNNEYVSSVDSVLRRVSPLFFGLFAEEYSLSLGLVVVIFFWFYFLFRFYQILGDFSTFSEGTSFIISFGLVVILSHLGFFNMLVKGIGWVLLSPESTWIRVLIFLGFCVLMVLVTEASKKLGRIRKEQREQEEKYKTKQEMNFIQRFGSKVRDAISKE